MEDEGLTELEVSEAEPVHGTGEFYCAEIGEMNGGGEYCGNGCISYQPRNGKNGICKSYRLPYAETDRKVTIKLPRLK